MDNTVKRQIAGAILAVLVLVAGLFWFFNQNKTDDAETAIVPLATPSVAEESVTEKETLPPSGVDVKEYKSVDTNSWYTANKDERYLITGNMLNDIKKQLTAEGIDPSLATVTDFEDYVDRRMSRGEYTVEQISQDYIDQIRDSLKKPVAQWLEEDFDAGEETARNEAAINYLRAVRTYENGGTLTAEQNAALFDVNLIAETLSTIKAKYQELPGVTLAQIIAKDTGEYIEVAPTVAPETDSVEETTEETTEVSAEETESIDDGIDTVEGGISNAD